MAICGIVKKKNLPLVNTFSKDFVRVYKNENNITIVVYVVPVFRPFNFYIAYRYIEQIKNVFDMYLDIVVFIKFCNENNFLIMKIILFCVHGHIIGITL